MTDIKQKSMEEMTLAELKQLAQELDVWVHPNAKEPTYIKKIEAHLANQNLDEETIQALEEQIDAEEVTTDRAPGDMDPHLENFPAASEAEHKMRQNRAASHYVRIVVNVNNPQKRPWPGQVYTVSNSVVGTKRKYVPFGNQAGWHVPRIVVNHLEEELYQEFYEIKDKNGNEITRSRMTPAYNIVELPPLTRDEIEDIRQRQLAEGLNRDENLAQ